MTMDTGKSDRRKELKSKKRKMKRQKLKMENDGLKRAMAAEEAGHMLILGEKKRKKVVSQGGCDETNKPEKLSQDDLDICMKKKKMKSTLKKAVKRKKKEIRRDESRENKFNGEDYVVEEISSEDGDYSRGMKKWILDYHQRRPGLDIIEQRLSEFIAEYEGEQAKARKEREALAAGGGWTVVVHHKGRKKTTDSESGVAVGSVSQAAVQDRMSKQKQKQIALDFYRFQKREAQRNEVMMLQSKFEQDKKRLQQLRAARKFRPY